MKNFYKYVCAFFALVMIFANTSSALAIQEVKEMTLINGIMDENFSSLKKIYRYVNEMKNQAKPFDRRHHRDRYRFEPGDKIPKEIMNLARSINSRFKILNGMISQSTVRNRTMLISELKDVTNNITVFCKRAIRANKDNNYTLYLAAAQGIEKEVNIGNNLLNDLEIVINDCIAEMDASKENL